VIAILIAADGCATDRSTAPTADQGGSFVMITAGAIHTCGLTSTGLAYCWGANQLGQVGDGSRIGRVKPALVRGGLSFTALAAGGENTCGLTVSGAAYCWGYNFFGQLGIGSGAGSAAGPESCLNDYGGGDACSTMPLAVTGGLSFAALSMLGGPCALTSAGGAYCWGSNDLGQLGDGSTTSSQQPVRRFGDYSSKPVAVSGGLTFASLASGTGTDGHACALTRAGAAYCWGNNYYGALGMGLDTGPQLCNPGSPTDFPCSTTPVPVSGGFSFTSIAVGGYHACGLTRSATYCWGNNGIGQLGDGTNKSSSTPVVVSGTLTFSALALGVGHTCALASNGAAYCWGHNHWGQLGTGSTSGPALCGGVACSLGPVAVSGGLSFTTLVAGGSHTCGLTSAGKVYCWGDNSFGQLGDGTTTSRLAPTPVAFP